MALRRWPVYCGNVEGADLKNNSQSTTHIDPEVGTGGMLRVLSILFKGTIFCGKIFKEVE